MSVRSRIVIGSWLLALLALSAPGALHAQEEDILYPGSGGGSARSGRAGYYFVTADAGLNYSFIGAPTSLPQGRAQSSYQESATGLAPFLGVGFGYQFSPDYSVSLRLAYDQRSGSYSGTYLETCTLFDEFTGQIIGTVDVPVRDETTITVGYLTLDAVASWYSGPFHLFAGPSSSIPISGSWERTQTIEVDTGTCIFFYGFPDSTKQITGEADIATNLLQRSSVLLGAGYSLDVAPATELRIQLALDLGLGDLIETGFTVDTRNPEGDGTNFFRATVASGYKLSSLRATAGLRFNLF